MRTTASPRLSLSFIMSTSGPALAISSSSARQATDWIFNQCSNGGWEGGQDEGEREQADLKTGIMCGEAHQDMLGGMFVALTRVCLAPAICVGIAGVWHVLSGP